MVVQVVACETKVLLPDGRPDMRIALGRMAVWGTESFSFQCADILTSKILFFSFQNFNHLNFDVPVYGDISCSLTEVRPCTLRLHASKPDAATAINHIRYQLVMLGVRSTQK